MKNQGEKTFTFDDPLILLAFAAFIYCVCWFAWYNAHEEISMVYAYIRYIEVFILYAASSVVSEVPYLSKPYHWVNELCDPNGFVGACQRNFYNVTWPEISNSSFTANLVCLVILTFYLIKWFRVIDKTHPLLNYIKSHNIQSFVKANIPLYPHLRMFSELDLVAKDLDDPLFGMSHTSRQFAYKHLLINGWKLEADGTCTPSLDREKALQIFRDQLGKHWTKSTELSVAETLLLACAIPRLAATDSSLSDDDFKTAFSESNDMILWCWSHFKKDPKSPPSDNSWLSPTIPLDKPRKIILKYIKSPVVQKIIEKHAYSRTVLFAFFMQARRLGVMQPAEFRWLRFFDRQAWYVLQNIGRPGAFAEGGAVLSHYLYESKQGSAIAEPQLDKAVNGLEFSVTNFKYLPADKIRYEKHQKAVIASKKKKN